MWKGTGIMRHLVPLGVGVCLVCLGSAVLMRGSSRVARASAAEINGSARPAVNVGCEDRDGDGFGRGCAQGPDCNDQDPRVHPGQQEICNFRDDDCNGDVDDAPGCVAPIESDGRVFVGTGEFIMGSPPGEGAIDEQPRHRVWISDFSLDKFEVTNRRYKACVKLGVCERPKLPSSHLRPDYFDNDRYGDFPVVFVDAHQAETYCHEQQGRLPTEAEWEKAARGPSPSLSRFPWGDREPDCSLANMGGPQSCLGDTDRVGRRPLGKSQVGAFDMAGNVWEWVADRYDSTYYQHSPSRNPEGPDKGTLRVIRGGCWESGADSLRVSCRKATVPSAWAYNVGFRCAYGKGG